MTLLDLYWSWTRQLTRFILFNAPKIPQENSVNFLKCIFFMYLLYKTNRSHFTVVCSVIVAQRTRRRLVGHCFVLTTLWRTGKDSSCTLSNFFFAFANFRLSYDTETLFCSSNSLSSDDMYSGLRTAATLATFCTLHDALLRFLSLRANFCKTYISIDCIQEMPK